MTKEYAADIIEGIIDFYERSKEDFYERRVIELDSEDVEALRTAIENLKK